MKAEPCEDIEQSYFGGVLERSFHSRTVASLEAERTKLGWGKTTARTFSYGVRTTVERLEKLSRRYSTYVVFMPLQRGGELVVVHLGSAESR